MLEKLKSGFKRTINWNIYQSKVPIEQQNQYLDFLIDPSFEVNKLFVLLFENKDNRMVQTAFYLPKVEIKNYNFMIKGKNVFDQPVKIDMRRYDNIRKIATGQGDDCITRCLLDYPYFKKLIAIDLSKQQVLDADPKAINQVY